MSARRIMIIEDEASADSDIEDLLAALGHRLIARTRTGEQALHLAARERPDLVLMDVRLQGAAEPIGLAVELRRRFHIPVVFVTDNSAEAFLERPNDAKPYGCLVKPVAVRELGSTIELALDRHQADEEIRRLARLYDVLSQVNQAIVRQPSRERLFDSVCALMVERASVDLAWIAWSDPPASRMRPVSFCGQPGVCIGGTEAAKLSPTDTPGPVAEAVDEGRHAICRDCSLDTCFYASLHKSPYGIRACGSFPIRFRGRVCGALTVLTSEPGFFGEREIHLLEEVAMDISFALDKLENDAERDRALTAHDSQRARFEAILENIPAGVVMYAGSPLRVVVSNRYGAQLLGRPATSTIAETQLSDHFQVYRSGSGELYPLTDLPLTQALNGQSTTVDDMEVRRPDGSRVQLEARGAPVRDASGAVVAAVVVFQDITERKRTEAALAEAALRRHVLFERSCAGIVVMGSDGSVRDLNARFAEMLGYSLEEARNLYVWDWDAVYSREQLLGMTRADPVLLPPPAVFETRHRRKDGSVFDVEIETNLLEWNGDILRYCFCRDVSARKQAERAQQVSEDRLRLALQASRMGVWQWDARSEAIFWSPECLNVFGVASAPADIHDFRALVHPDDWPAVQGSLQRSLAEDSLHTVEYRVLCAGGSLRWVAGHGRASYDPAGKPLGMLGTVMDITARKQTEAALRDSENRFRTIFDQSAVAITVHDTKTGEILQANREALRMYGFDSVEELRHFAFRDEPPPYSLEESLQKIRAAVTEGRQRFEWRHRHRDGRVLWQNVDLNAIVIDGADRVIAVIQDITERKRAEEALRESEMRYRTLFEEATEGIALADVQTGELLDFNRTFLELTGYERGELLGRSQTVLHPPEAIGSTFTPEFIEHARKGRGTSRTVDLVTRSGAIRQAQIKANTLSIGGKTIVQGFFRDITDELRRQREREAYVELLRIINEEYDTGQLLRNLVAMLQEQTGCDAVGVRLRSGFDFPYAETRGFDKDFLRTESSLCVPLSDGQPLRDEQSQPILTCICGFVLRGLTEPSLPVFTERGSFWANDTAEAIALLENRLHTPRHRCLHDGYGSIALVPLRHGGQSLGLLQFNARRKGHFPPDLLDFLENAADQIAVALAQHQSQASLRDSEQRFRDVGDAVGEFIWEIDREGRYTFVSERVQAVLGYRPEELLGERPLDRLMPETGGTKEFWRDMSAQGRPFRDIESPAVTRSGETVWLSVSGVPINDVRGEIIGFRGAAMDITERKNAEEARLRLEAQLFQAQKMESVGRLAGGVAHDFNNMLSVIGGNAELALDTLNPEDPLYRDLQEILHAANRSADLTRQLLAFARKQTISPKVLDLNDTISGLLKMLRRLIGEDIDLVWKPGNDVWKINVDPSQIDQILANLVVNARDAIAGTGSVSLHTANVFLSDTRYAEEPGFISGEYVMLAVSDTGAGMDPNTLKHVFEPFFTTKDIGKGTGLGLATVYGIVRQNSGFIDVKSQPGHGTTFRIYLPRYLAEATPTTADDDSDLPKGGTETILLVEDEVSVLDLGQRFLDRLGYTVLTARTPGKALEIFDASTDRIDLLITDVIMPEMNGRDLTERLLKLKPGLKTMYISGYTSDVIARRGVLEEGVRFVQKPFSMKALAEEVRRALD